MTLTEDTRTGSESVDLFVSPLGRVEGDLDVRVTIEDAADVEHMVTVLMGDKVQSRKEYIFENADFNKNNSDMFEKLKD